jgi:hypothetical protein
VMTILILVLTWQQGKMQSYEMFILYFPADLLTHIGAQPHLLPQVETEQAILHLRIGTH